MRKFKRGKPDKILSIHRLVLSNRHLLLGKQMVLALYWFWKKTFIAMFWKNGLWTLMHICKHLFLGLIKKHSQAWHDKTTWFYVLFTCKIYLKNNLQYFELCTINTTNKIGNRYFVMKAKVIRYETLLVKKVREKKVIDMYFHLYNCIFAWSKIEVLSMNDSLFRFQDIFWKKDIFDANNNETVHFH